MSLERLRAAHANLTEIMRLHGLAAAGTPASAPAVSRDDLPLATCHVDEAAEVLVVGLAAEAAADTARHVPLIEWLADGAPARLTYVRVVRDGAPSKKEDARPLWGGVRMSSSGTTNVVIRQHGGAVQVIASSHVVGPGIGQSVGQSATSSKYGEVIKNPSLGNRRSDSALTSITNRRIQGAPYQIWRAPDEAFTVKGFVTSADTPVGLAVWMQGAQTEALQGGGILRTNVTVTDSRGTLVNQVYASYAAQSGDSGAPVFYLTFEDGAVVYTGIHVGRIIENDQEISFYSPWEGVRDDLGLTLDL
ncbi:MAG TPA: hypothetical protein VN253_14880 [Kofleriaceae bacterium]|nr:hypothetical protein [Kofleriaceae bacterium]